MRRYRETRREFDGKFLSAKTHIMFSDHLSLEIEQDIQQQRAAENPPGYNLSVYTIEHGRQTLISYNSDMPPRSHPGKDEFPPTYDDALKLHQMQTAESPPTNTTVATVTNTQRRISV